MSDCHTGLWYYQAPNCIFVTPECFETCNPAEICESKTDEAVTSYNVDRVDLPEYKLPADINVSPMLLCMGGTKRRLRGFRCAASFSCPITPAPRDVVDIPVLDKNPHL